MNRLLKNIKWSAQKYFNLIFKNKNVKRVRSLKNTKTGKSIFLVGNGPSLNQQNLTPLEMGLVDYCTVNCGYRIFKNSKPTYHFVSDQERFKKFAQEILGCGAQKIFIRENFTGIPKEYQEKDFIYKVLYRNGGLIKRGYDEDISTGIGHDSSVLLFATQILAFMGYDNIYIIGCDLSYDENNKYAYKMNDTDLEHEENPITKSKRLNMIAGNNEFNALNIALRKRGIKLFNAGHNGKLNSLKRLTILEAYDQIFDYKKQ